MPRLARLTGVLLLAGSAAWSSASASSVERLEALEQELQRVPAPAALERVEGLIEDARARGESADSLEILRASALLRLGLPAAAEAVLAPLAAHYPGAGRVQLDHAFALFLLRRDEEARSILRRVGARDDLPKPVRRNVEDLLAEIRARATLRVDLDVSLWHDTNVNNAPEVATVGIPFGDSTLPLRLHQQPVEAWVLRTGANLQWRRNLPDDARLSLHTAGGLARSTAIGASEHSRVAARAQVGLRHGHVLSLGGVRRPGDLGVDAGTERHWWGGEGFSSTLWTGLTARQRLTTRWQAELATQVWKTWHDDQPSHVDPEAISVRLSADRELRRGLLGLGAAVSRKRPERPFLRARAVEVSLHTVLRFRSDWTVRGRLRSAWSRHDALHPVFGVVRKDRTQDGEISISHRALSFRGYLPELRVGLSRTQSTIDLYDRNAANVSVTVNRLF